MNESTRQRDEMALSPLEAIGHEAERVERARKELDEIVRFGNETAMKLRVLANCLDSGRSEKMLGMMEQGMFLVENCSKENSSACEYWEADPSVRNVFRIPEGVMELMEQMREAENLLHSYEDMLNASLRSYLRNCVSGVG